jgi:hypothetical protein
MTLTTSSTVVQSADVVACDLAGETALLHFETGIYYGLDATGTTIWSLIQSPQSVRNLLDLIMQEYEVERERCEEDLLSLLQSLADERLVEMAPCAA